MNELQSDRLEWARSTLTALKRQLQNALVGQEPVIDETLIGLLCGAHVLLEGVPGLGKTMLVKALARTFSGEFSRIQFTPDLMPSDVIGHTFFDMASSQFVTRRGPVFAHLLLADEINRAPAKTQAALLEVMQERHVTLEGEALPLPNPFMVLATQNPIEQEGTYPLPEAQLDRFLFKIRVQYPSLEDEVLLTRHVTLGRTGADFNLAAVEPVLSVDEVSDLQAAAAQVSVDDQVVHYAVSLVRATRNAPRLAIGAGPRGSIALVRGARARALMQGRPYATPDDVKHVALPALRHRVTTAPEAEIEGLSADALIMDLLDGVPAPRV